jgi:hypothetical protein
MFALSNAVYENKANITESYKTALVGKENVIIKDAK